MFVVVLAEKIISKKTKSCAVDCHLFFSQSGCVDWKPRDLSQWESCGRDGRRELSVVARNRRREHCRSGGSIGSLSGLVLVFNVDEQCFMPIGLVAFCPAAKCAFLTNTLTLSIW